MGSSLIRFPVALKIALAMVATAGVIGGSPTTLPPKGPKGSGCSMKITSTSGVFEMGRHFGVAIVGIDGNSRSAVSDQLLGKRHADSLHNAAFDLALGGKPVDDRARIMGRDVAGDLHVARPGIHFHFGEMGREALSLDVLKRRVLVVARPMSSPALRTTRASEASARVGLHEYLTLAQIQLFRFASPLTDPAASAKICLRTSSAAAITAGPVNGVVRLPDSPTEYGVTSVSPLVT